MISITAFALFLFGLACVCAGACAWDFLLGCIAKCGHRILYEPACARCERSVERRLSKNAVCFDCVAKDSENGMREIQQQLENIDAEYEKSRAKSETEYLERKREIEALFGSGHSSHASVEDPQEPPHAT